MRTRSSFNSSPRVRRLRYRRDMRLGFPCSPHHLSVIREKIFVASRDLASATVMLLPGVPLRIDLSRIAKCGRLPEANSTSRKCLKFGRIRASCNASPLSPLALREEFAPLHARFCYNRSGHTVCYVVRQRCKSPPPRTTAPVPKHGRATRREAPHPRSTQVARPFSIQPQPSTDAMPGRAPSRQISRAYSSTVRSLEK